MPPQTLLLPPFLPTIPSEFIIPLPKWTDGVKRRLEPAAGRDSSNFLVARLPLPPSLLLCVKSAPSLFSDDRPAILFSRVRPFAAARLFLPRRLTREYVSVFPLSSTRPLPLHVSDYASVSLSPCPTASVRQVVSFHLSPSAAARFSFLDRQS